MSEGGGCESALTAKIRCEWVKSRECGKLLQVKKVEKDCLQELCKASNFVWE